MKEIITIGIDYSNICKNYNTMYLDRDNDDPETVACMKAVLAWTRAFFSDLLAHFNYSIYMLNSASKVSIDEVASKRFLFYSLEKEITMQSFVIQKEHTKSYDNQNLWIAEAKEGSMLVNNDEEGAGLYICLIKDSVEHLWIKERLKDFSLDEVPYTSK